MDKQFNRHMKLLDRFRLKMPNSELYAALERNEKILKSVMIGVTTKETEDSPKPIIPSTSSLIAEELFSAKKILIEANSDLLQTLRTQHEASSKSQKLNVILAIVALLLAILSIGLTIYSLKPKEQEALIINELKVQSELSKSALDEAKYLRKSIDSLTRLSTQAISQKENQPVKIKK